jgi:hypothetical protein
MTRNHPSDEGGISRVLQTREETKAFYNKIAGVYVSALTFCSRSSAPSSVCPAGSPDAADGSFRNGISTAARPATRLTAGFADGSHHHPPSSSKPMPAKSGILTPALTPANLHESSGQLSCRRTTTSRLEGPATCVPDPA